jgi:hypothetical protein
MTVNAKIRTVDYNFMQNEVARVLGTGVANFGYGQTLESSQVNLSSRITVNEISRLRNDIISCYRHIYGTIPTELANPQIGNLVKWTPIGPESSEFGSSEFNEDDYNVVSPTSPDISPFNQFPIFASDIVNNRFSPSPFLDDRLSQPQNTTSTTWPGPFGLFWRTTIECRVIVSFPTAEDARYFFNTGGQIKFSSTRTGGSNTDQNNIWSSFLQNTVGLQGFGGNFPTSGLGDMNGGNFYRLRNNFTSPYYDVPSAGLYSLNRFKLWARTIDAPNNDNSAGGATSMEFLIEWVDDSIGTGGGPDQVDGTINLFVTESKVTAPPTGIFTIQSPSVSVGRIEPQQVIPNSTYTITPSVTSINEGDTVRFTVGTTNVPNNTSLFYSVFGGPNITNNDFINPTGTFSVFGSLASGQGIIDLQIRNDFETEGSEFFYLEIRSGSVSGPIIATSQSVTINDTSRLFSFNISSNRNTTTSLRSLAIANGWDQISRCEAIINSGVFLSGTRNTSYNRTDSPVRHGNVCGLLLSGTWPNGLILRNNGGTIAGAGGAGSAGGGTIVTGGPGGPGLVIVQDFSVTSGQFILINFGTISGGGGGGGGGTVGGGGGGAPFGAGGSGTNNGSAATVSGGGAGGSGSPAQFGAGGGGGAQGRNGAQGQTRTSNVTQTGRGNGGQAGISIIGESRIDIFNNFGGITNEILSLPSAST